MKTSDIKFAVIIPARYASSRFPGKPLVSLGGKTVIERVYTRAREATENVYVATDDDRILREVERFGGQAVMTSTSHRSGTDRIREAVDNLHLDADVIINLQGDEPFIRPEQIYLLKDCFEKDSTTQIATLARKFDKSRGFEALFDPSLVKVTFASNGNALYFSRSIIPYVRGAEWKEWLDNATFHTHIGMYAYRTDVLRRITELPFGEYEKAESLEQLRWLQAGYQIKIAVTEYDTIGIDTPEDLRHAEEFLNRDQQENNTSCF